MGEKLGTSAATLMRITNSPTNCHTTSRSRLRGWILTRQEWILSKIYRAQTHNIPSLKNWRRNGRSSHTSATATMSLDVGGRPCNAASPAIPMSTWTWCAVTGVTRPSTLEWSERKEYLIWSIIGGVGTRPVSQKVNMLRIRDPGLINLDWTIIYTNLSNFHMILYSINVCTLYNYHSS